MLINHTRLFHGALFLASLLLTACGGGGGGSTPPPAGTSFTIGGTTSGLISNGLELLNNGGDKLTVAPNPNGSGSTDFTFATALASGDPYDVTVSKQPEGLTCTVSNGSNTVASASIANITVACTKNSYKIGVSVTGLAAATLDLTKSANSETLNITDDGVYVFPTAQLYKSFYQVTVTNQPTTPITQTCSVTNGIGLVPGSDLTLSVTCAANTYTIGGTITDLGANSGLVLQNNLGNDLIVPAGATSFTFSTAIPSGSNYSVTVKTQPSLVTCSVNNGSGQVVAGNISNVSVICAATPYAIGGNVTGLAGSGLVLQNNGGDDLNVAAASSVYAFPTKITPNSTYNVTVKTQPNAPDQICSVTNATGTVVNADIGDANVDCKNAYTIGGTISGDPAAASGIGPILQNNGGDNLFIPTLPASGVSVSFTFSTPVAESAVYAVTQLSQARTPSQNCNVITGGSNNDGSGTVSGGPVSSVAITCTLSSAPVARFAYVTNSTADPAPYAPDTVSAYTIASSGVLAAATPATTASGNEPEAIAVDPAGKFAYVLNKKVDSISGYSINSSSGVLTALTDVDGTTAGDQSTIATGDAPVSIAVHPSGMFVYVVNQGNGTTTGNSLSVYSVNSSGALSATDADGTISNTQLTIATGALPYDISIDPFGYFAYVANFNADSISAYSIDQSSGALTPVAGSPFTAGDGPNSIAVDPTGQCALVTNSLTGGSVKAYSISGSGALTYTATLSAGNGPRSIAIDPTTGLYAYVANAGDKTIAAASWSAGTATVTTSSVHGYNAGAVIHISGANPAGYNGTYTIVSVPSTTTFTVAIASDPGAWSSGGITEEGSVSAFNITLSTCAITEIDTKASGKLPLSINVDPSGQFVYVANYSSNDISVYGINASDGTLTLLETKPTGLGPTSVTTTQ